MKDIYRVYAGVSEQYGYARQVLHGVQSYLRQAPHHWWFRRGPISSDLIDSIMNWIPDCIIVQCPSVNIDTLLFNSGIPVVNISSKLASYQLPTVIPDNYAAGTLAAEHFYQCGIRHMSYWPHFVDGLLGERNRGFIATAETLTATLHIPPKISVKNRGMEQLFITWMKNLPVSIR
ncbi:MAG: hypothetical protein WCJ56_11515 [bacterium]